MAQPLSTIQRSDGQTTDLAHRLCLGRGVAVRSCVNLFKLCRLSLSTTTGYITYDIYIYSSVGSACPVTSELTGTARWATPKNFPESALESYAPKTLQ